MLGVRLVAIGSVLGLAWTSTSGDTASEAALIGGSALSARTFEMSSITAAQAEPPQTPLSNSRTSLAPPSISRVEITSDGTVVFAGLASPGTRVVVRRGADGLGSASVDETGAWQLQVAEPLGSGEHEIFTEASGNTARGSATIAGDELRIAIPRSFDGPMVAFERPAEEVARERNAIAIETRRQAERLAEAASRRFTELSHELAEKAKEAAKGNGVGRNAESVDRQGGHGRENSAGRPAGDRVGDAGSAIDTASHWLQAWLTKANRDYQREVIRRLQIPAPALSDLVDDKPPPLPIPSPARHAPEDEPAGSGETAQDRIAEASRLAEESEARRRRDEEAAKLEAEKAAAARARHEREEAERKAARLLAERLEAENEARRTAERKAEAARKATADAEREAARRQAEREAATAAAKAAEERARAETAAAEKAAAEKAANEKAAMAKAKADAERAAAEAEAAKAARVAEEAAEPAPKARADAETAQRRALPAERTVADDDVPPPVRKDTGRAPASRLGSHDVPPPQRPSAAPTVTEDQSTRSRYAEGDTDEEDVRHLRTARRHVRPRVAGWRSPHASCPKAGRRVHPPATYTVASGDTLWSIAFKHYRRGRYYPLIEDANSEIVADRHMIRPCQRLYLPKFDRTALSILADGREP